MVIQGPRRHRLPSQPQIPIELGQLVHVEIFLEESVHVMRWADEGLLHRASRGQQQSRRGVERMVRVKGIIAEWKSIRHRV